MNLIFSGALFAIFICVLARPPKKSPDPNHTDDTKISEGVSYERYLKEVVEILEQDPKIQERLKSMPKQDIMEGKIAEALDEVNRTVRSKLTQLKLKEIERLGQLYAMNEGPKHIGHVDVGLKEFGKNDVRMLIKQAISDMEELDRKRKEDFKEYEMKKEANKKHKLAQMELEERQKAEKELEQVRQRHGDHEKLKHPGGRDQLEEVWEETDGMDKDSFNPEAFFSLHDLNGDGFWEGNELEALFQSELDKLYNSSDPDDDINERIEEMNRMREHVMTQMDKNKDARISLEEFKLDTEAQTDGEDAGWEDIGDQRPAYTDEELQRFQEDYAKEMGWGDTAYSTAVPSRAPPYNLHPDDNQQVDQKQHNIDKTYGV